MGIDVRRIKEHIVLTLGAGKVGLEVDDCHVNEAIRFAIEQLNAFLGWEQQYGLIVFADPLQEGAACPVQTSVASSPKMKEITPSSQTTSPEAVRNLAVLPDDVYYVSNVYYSTRNYPFGDLVGYASYFPELQLFRGRVDHVQFYQWMQWIQNTNKLLSLDPKWERLQGNLLLLDPPPSLGSPVIYEYTPVYDIGGTVFNTELFNDTAGSNIPSTEHYIQLWIMKYALAHTKEILGRVRSRFSAYPSGEETVELDGAALLQEAKDEKIALMQELDDMSYPAGIYVL